MVVKVVEICQDFGMFLQRVLTENTQDKLENVFVIMYQKETQRKDKLG